jgi:hypothetical protein
VQAQGGGETKCAEGGDETTYAGRWNIKAITGERGAHNPSSKHPSNLANEIYKEKTQLVASLPEQNHNLKVSILPNPEPMC